LALVREQTIPNERPPLVDEVSANFVQIKTIGKNALILGIILHNDKSHYLLFSPNNIRIINWKGMG
jgi:hypothetical protein